MQMDVIRKLRLHMIVSTVAVLMLVLAVILVALCVTLSRCEQREIGRLLDVIVDNGGRLPEPRSFATDDVSRQQAGELRWSLFSMRRKGMGFHHFFSFIVHADGSLVCVSQQFPASPPQDELDAVIGRIVQTGRRQGLYESFFYRVCPRSDGDRLLVMLDCQGGLATLRRLYGYSLLVWLLSLLAALVFSFALSGAIVRPVAELLERQKRFVSDAGHELKTPVAVIAANVDVLLSDLPDNRWLQYIKTETERMNHLVQDLLFLARNDAGRALRLLPFDFSSAVRNAVLPFESIIFEQGKQFDCTVQEGLVAAGDEQQIKQVAVILVDNAVKNSEAGALIRVTVRQEGQRAVLRVYNTGRGIAEKDLSKIFLRFYRSDESRARKTGGYGLGLAIAKAISDAHGAVLTAASRAGEWAEFTFALPLQPHKT